MLLYENTVCGVNENKGLYYVRKVSKVSVLLWTIYQYLREPFYMKPICNANDCQVVNFSLPGKIHSRHLIKRCDITLEWCQLTLSCVSLSTNTQPSVPAIKLYRCELLFRFFTRRFTNNKIIKIHCYQLSIHPNIVCTKRVYRLLFYVSVNDPYGK